MATTELIQYHNDLNLVPLGKLSSLEQNFLFRLIKLVHDEGYNQLFYYDKDAFTGITQAQIHNSELLRVARGAANKFINLVFKRYIEKKDTISESYSNLFEKFVIDYDKKTNEFKGVQVKVGEEFAYFVNALYNHFTLIDELEHITLKSKYAKILYREIMARNKMANFFEIKFKDLKEKFGLSPDYPSNNLDKILTAAKKELTNKELKLFSYALPLPKLEWKKTYKGLGGGRAGRTIDKYIFEFEKVETKSNDEKKLVKKEINIQNHYTTTKVIL